VVALVDPLTGVMLLVVTGVGLLIHVYSIGYMHDARGTRASSPTSTCSSLDDDARARRQLPPALRLLEAVGLCSYLLIGFWYTRDSAAAAGKKAFIVNRVGTSAFGLAVMWIWIAFGTLDYTAVFKAPRRSPRPPPPASRSCSSWAPCASRRRCRCTCGCRPMEGPTPVSALIHAATMVTAGVYMVARSHALFERSGVALDVVLWSA